MRWKFDRDDLEMYKCCFCCHVRTGTLILGILYLLAHMSALGFFLAAMFQPQLCNQVLVVHLEQPQTANNSSQVKLTKLPNLDEKSTPSPVNWLQPKLPIEGDSEYDRRDVFRSKNCTLEGLFAASLLGVAFMAVTSLLIYGTIRGISKHLTPFFCVQVFELCLTGLTMLSYFSDVVAVRRWIKSQTNLPMKDELLMLDNDHLTLLTLIVFVSTLSVKAYLIGVVWSCYKYLKQHELSMMANRMRIYDSEEMVHHEDTEMLLPPKYEDVIQMTPDENTDSTPPPAYSPPSQ